VDARREHPRPRHPLDAHRARARERLTPRRLVINADDLGFAPGVNRGIVEAHEAGSLSSASMMVTTPAFAEAVDLVRTRVPALGVGLHLDLITGRPLAEVPTLVDGRTGLFHPLAELARRAVTGRVSAADVRRECEAQIAALVAAGITPTHLDSHRHSHALPGILPAVLASAASAGIRIVRRPLDAPVIDDPAASAKMLVLHAAWRAAERGVDAAGRELIARAPRFRGIALQGAPDLGRRLMALLDRLPPGATELMLHPGYDDAILAAQDPYRAERERELAVLTSSIVRGRLGRGDIRLVTFRDL
jgi:chitin disaccharide deacetylase